MLFGWQEGGMLMDVCDDVYLAILEGNVCDDVYLVVLAGNVCEDVYLATLAGNVCDLLTVLSEHKTSKKKKKIMQS